jgi:caffeoyl-CoA O-methyltransferase
VLDPRTEDDKAIVRFNEEVLAGDRVEAAMLPIADGLTLARLR